MDVGIFFRWGIAFLGLIAVAYIFYDYISQGSGPISHAFYLAFVVLFSYISSSYAKGSVWDQRVTLVLWIITLFVFYLSYYYLVHIAEIPWNNPFVLILFSVQIFFFSIILLSRYIGLNIVKIMGWVIGLITVLMVFFTTSIWSSLDICLLEEKMSSSKESASTVMGVYLGWIVVVASLFALGEMAKTRLWYGLLFLGFFLSIWLTGFSVRKCKCSQNEREPSWVENSTHLLLIISYLSFFLGKIYSAAWYAFLVYYILDRCQKTVKVESKGKEDSKVNEKENLGGSRKIGAGAMLMILFPLGILLKLLGHIFH
jgi:hypothetical protein